MKITPRHAVAGTLLLVGTLVMVRGLWRAWPGPRPTPVAQREGADLAAVSPVAPPWFSMSAKTDTSSEAIDGVVASLRDQIESACGRLPSRSLGGSGTKLLAQSAADYLRTVLEGSPEGYLSYVEANGGKQDLDLSVESNARAFRTFFESVAEPYAHRNISLPSVAVRPRVIKGANVPQGDFGGRTSMSFAENRFPALQKLAFSTKQGQVIVGDTYEVLMPVEYVYKGETLVVVLGVWMTWCPDEARWLPSRIVTYAPPGKGPPILHPVL